MLEIYNILWVVPGVIFVSIYNRSRPGQAINLLGWPYIFSLVILSVVTWFPAEFLSQFFSIEIEVLNSTQNKLLNISVVLGFSVIFTFFWLLIFQWGWFAKLILPAVYDDFYTQCLEWRKKPILVTLKNGKAYVGLLWKSTKNPRANYETQTITILPLKSGYREMDKKRIMWTTNYPYDDKLHGNDMEMILPRSEIITFGKFNEHAHQYFESLKQEMSTEDAKNI